MTQSLLQPDEHAAVELFNGGGAARFVLICDHASPALPRTLGTLGLSDAALRSHIAWDIGALGVAQQLALQLDAPLVFQRYSRLVIDCNRPFVAPDSIPETSGGIEIPGNRQLSALEKGARRSAIFEPYHARISAVLGQRQSYSLISVHSFTPELFGAKRPFHAGVLYDKDARLAAPLLSLLRQEPELVIGENEPYAASPTTDFAIIEYGERRGAPYVELEVRQDLVADAAGQRLWAERFARHLRIASGAFHW
jgi:predicted N-formylglutamate amidohydrolase